MNPFLCTPEEELASIMYAFGNTPIEKLAPCGYKKYVLNKLRWILIDFGISHFRLAYPPMPIIDLIQIGASLEEHVTSDSVIDVSAYYQILAARNILKLLDKAYDFNENVKLFYNLELKRILSSINNDNQICNPTKLSTLPKLLHMNALTPNDTIKSAADFMLFRLEPIIDLADKKNKISQIITDETNEEKNILIGYELYFYIFPLFFSWNLSDSFSTLFLSDKYRKKHFWDNYETTPIDKIRAYALKKGCD